MLPRAIAVSLLLLTCYAPRAAARDNAERQIPWDGLSVVIGRRVRIALPDGARIEGRAASVETDALAVNIEKTSNKSAYPKGRFLVPRATLKAVDVIERSTAHWRIVSVALGAGVGYLALRAAINLSKSSTLGAAGMGTLAVGLPVLGYFVGNAADRRAITYIIIP